LHPIFKETPTASRIVMTTEPALILRRSDLTSPVKDDVRPTMQNSFLKINYRLSIIDNKALHC
jgi:hypothetical protein